MSEQGRWTKPPGDAGDDPRERDEELHDPERARLLAESRPVTNDEEPSGQQGTTADQPGTDPGGYPEDPLIEDEEPT